MKQVAGLDLIADTPGSGRAAANGDTVAFRIHAFLNRGDRVAMPETHETVLGSRNVIAGVEYALLGMQVGGHRRVRIGPHLAYREPGIAGIVPANAVLEVELWLDAIR